MENRVNNHDHFTAFQAYYRHDIKAYIKLTCGHCRGTLLHKHFFHYLSTWVSWLSSLILSLLLNKDRKQYINPVVLEAGFLSRVKKIPHMKTKQRQVSLNTYIKPMKIKAHKKPNIPVLR